MWAAPIHDADWLSSTLKSVEKDKSKYPAFKKIHSILTVASEVRNGPINLLIKLLS